MKQEINISNAEMVVMRVIWSLSHAKVEEVIAQISERQDWTLATVKTLLGRLVKKDMLETEKDGRAFIYRAKVGEEDVIHLLTEDLLLKVCATKQVLVISDAISMSNLTKEDITMLVEQLQQKSTVEAIECSCLDDEENCRCIHHK